jgi:hypothetical protein
VGSTRGGIALFPKDGPLQWLLRGDFDEVLGMTADRRHALVARTLGATSVELVDVPVDGSPSTSLASTDIRARKGLQVSPDDKQVVWSACVELSQIIGFDAAGRLRPAIQSDMPEPSSLTIVPHTQQLVIVSTRGGKAAPWLVGLSTDALPRAISVGNFAARDVAISHDGALYVVTVPGDGLYVGAVEGGAGLHRVTSDGFDSSPSFRADDKRIVFTRHTRGKPTRVMSVPVEGGELSDVLGDDSDGAAPSPVDDRIAYLDGPSSAELVPRIWDGRTARPLSPKLPAGRYGYPRFSPDGRRLALVRGDTDLVEVDVASGAVLRTLATPTGDQLAYPTYTPAGLVVIRVRFQGNLWLADTGL